ncbi:DUF1996 domain-containing protein [Virgisporangium ochraceum]|uniref:DUF1996 domain-containing protein n=1 Tax=Virgisporangium ochraceum TaxID=65505 RepID=A0A8J4EFN6_9ACTN|nr:DUF1996 domain-containing protein [Virgisporangium ochraceum]GIJ72911.1 hypothetical protein Voc01_078280 [Virgisporangium ochraceum]
MRHGTVGIPPRRLRVGLVVVTAVGLAVAGIGTSVWNARASAEAAPRSAFVRIQDVAPNVRTPQVLPTGSTGVFTVDCGTNGNRKFSPDNPVAQPGVKNGAQHVHDFVGNLSISAESSDSSLEESDTTCRNGDRSSYFWPVVRIDRKANVMAPDVSGTPTVSCPSVAGRLPAVPQQARAEVDRNLALLGQQVAEANQRLAATRGQGGPDFVNNAILGPLRSKRIATLDRIAIAIGRTGPRPTGLESLADCDLSYDGAHAGHAARRTSRGQASTPLAVTPTVNCPTVRDRLPGVPAQALDEVNRNLDLLDKQIAEANQRLVATQGQGGPNFVSNAILGPLRDKRVATLDRIAIAIGRHAARPTALESFAQCALTNGGGVTATPGGASPAPTASPSDLPGVVGPNLEIAGNVGGIVRPASVTIEYRGNAVDRVVPMPKFLKAIVGDAKPTSRGPANARATWTCSGFTDRLSAKYVICPAGSQVMRVHNFASCWDGRNTDSANHRDHLKFADPVTGACPSGTVAVPQLRITIAYDIPRSVQKKGQYQLDSFPEENHNPFSDHNDFANVNSTETMARIAACINAGGRCR